MYVGKMQEMRVNGKFKKLQLEERQIQLEHSILKTETKVESGIITRHFSYSLGLQGQLSNFGLFNSSVRDEN